jgi:murein DD-endopeptidase MepM/ murein hydrolase activator NlpD
MMVFNAIHSLKRALLLAAVIGAFALSPGVLRAEQSPFFADDLKPGERVKSGDHGGGDQALGHDFGVVRYLGNGDWSGNHPGTDGKKNEHRLIWGKPVYAARDGEVVRSWRNAPDNPKPGVKHDKFLNGMIPGGGNHILVEHADGTQMLYAHFRKGSVAKKWCPVDDQFTPLISDPPLPQDPHKGHWFPENQRPKIKKGDFIGLVGNSGSSSGPHLHWHQIDGNGKALAIPLQRGLIKDYQAGSTDLENWTALKGKPIPQKPTLFWPPRRIHAEYTRHAFPAADYGRMFLHLSDSGYQLARLDGYSVGGKAFYNFTWNKANGSWRAYHSLSQANFKTKLDDSKEAGFEPVYIDSYTLGSQVRYNIIFRKNVDGSWLLRTDRTQAQHQAILDQAKQDGLKPVAVSVISVGGQRRYSALYRSTSIGSWVLKSTIAEADYNDVFEDNRKAGRLPIHLDAYMHGGKPYVSAIFASKPAGAFKARHGLSGAQLQTEFDSAMQQGYHTTVVTAFNGANSQHRYFAVWRK